MKKLYFICAVLLALPIASQAQVFIQNTMFPFNKTVYNPAAAGASGVTTITGMYRAQWRGVPGAPTTFTLSADGAVRQLRGGIGGYVINDQLGPFRSTGANLSYAFRAALGDPEEESTPTLAIGAQAGYVQKGLNSLFQFDQTGQIDPLLGQGNGNFSANVGTANLGAGIYFSGPADKYYLGFSAQDLLEPSLSGLFRDGAKARVPRSYYLMGGYTFTFSERTNLQPNFCVRSDGRSTQFDLNALINFKPMVFGIGHRWKDSFSGIAGFNISDRFFFAYSYDYTISTINNPRDVHSHELILSYRFPRVEKAGPMWENIFNK